MFIPYLLQNNWIVIIKLEKNENENIIHLSISKGKGKKRDLPQSYMYDKKTIITTEKNIVTTPKRQQNVQ